MRRGLPAPGPPATRTRDGPILAAAPGSVTGARPRSRCDTPRFGCRLTVGPGDNEGETMRLAIMGSGGVGGYFEIGRASCRERVSASVGGVSSVEKCYGN